MIGGRILKASVLSLREIGTIPFGLKNDLTSFWRCHHRLCGERGPPERVTQVLAAHPNSKNVGSAFQHVRLDFFVECSNALFHDNAADRTPIRRFEVHRLGSIFDVPMVLFHEALAGSQILTRAGIKQPFSVDRKSGPPLPLQRFRFGSRNSRHVVRDGGGRALAISGLAFGSSRGFGATFPLGLRL